MARLPSMRTIAASGKPILFVQGEDVVSGVLVKDAIRGWCALT